MSRLKQSFYKTVLHKPPLGDLGAVVADINEAFDALNELAGCTEHIEENRARCEKKRQRTVEFVRSLYIKREAEIGGDYRVVSSQDSKGMAFTIRNDVFYVWDRLNRQAWAGLLILARVTELPVETGYLVFDKAPPELITMWNARVR